MSSRNRQNEAGRSIRGPQSALTDFLASQNISASRIRADADARRRAAAEANGETGENGETSASAANLNTEEQEDEETGNGATAATTAREQKRKRQAEAIEKIKKSKAYKKRKKAADDDSDSEDLARALFQEKATPLPGQMENCEICDKRFTVTPYSRAGPNGGLLCPKCGKDLAKDNDAAKKKKKKAAPTPGGGGRRKIQSKILDGSSPMGAKSLLALCIETLANNVHLADDLGDLPPKVIDRIARMLSKRRLLDPKTLNLFLQPHAEDVVVYDGARLSSDDIIRIFQTVPKLKLLKLRNAVQFKDSVMEYLITRNLNLESLNLHGANLLAEESWKAYLEAKGQHLRSLEISYTDKHVGDNLMACIQENCPNLSKLKICHNQEVSDEGIKHIAEMKSLQHLGLHLVKYSTTEPYVHLVQSIGKNLQTLSLRDVPDLDDRLLDAIHENCRSLSKLRITLSEEMTDAGFARLFTNWANKPLTFIDLEKCRHVDSSHPRENEHMVGLCSDGFRALMKHSAKSLQRLNVHACRHISAAAFEDAFGVDKLYPELEKVEVSFCEEVTDFIVGSIFRSCPNLKELNVFGCMKIKDVRVPRGKILVGVPNAMGMVIEGTE